MHKSHPNIWYVHPYAGGPGVGRYSRPYFLAHHWSERNCLATVITSAEHHLLDAPQLPGTRLIQGVPYEFLPAKPYRGNGISRMAHMLAFSLSLWQQGDRLLASHGRPDVIIASSPHPYHFVAAHRLARKFNALSILEVRDLWPLSLIELVGLKRLHPLVAATAVLEKFSYRTADKVVSLLPHTRDHMISLGLDQAKWHYIPNGVDSAELASDETMSEPLRRLQTWRNEGKRVVLYAGAIGEPNNLQILIEAAYMMRHTNARFLIVGRGSQYENLKRSIALKRLQAKVKLFPQINKNAALTLMRHADIGFISLVSQSIFRFGISPNKLFDYMHAALPVVCAVSASNDPTAEADCGRTVAPASPEAIAVAIADLLALPEGNLRTLGNNGLRYVRTKHAYAKLAADYLELAGAGKALSTP